MVKLYILRNILQTLLKNSLYIEGDEGIKRVQTFNDLLTKTDEYAEDIGWKVRK